MNVEFADKLREHTSSEWHKRRWEEAFKISEGAGFIHLG
jgi:hypothetical protein